jgi:hypothetical protein
MIETDLRLRDSQSYIRSDLPRPTPLIELAQNRMDWASVESSRNRTPLWAHEIAPGLAIRWPPPTMLATDAEWWGRCKAVG